jgi:malate dehydrogenase (oxaloacetate-decarboxylating)(NADP+)
VIRFFIHKAQDEPKRIVFPEGTEDKILRATQIILDDKIAKPILLGNPEIISERINELGLELNGVEIIRPSKSSKYQEYVKEFYELRMRKGMTLIDAQRQLKIPNIFGMTMVRRGDADGLISGLTQHYPDTVKPALQIIGKEEGVQRIAGMYMLIFKNQTIYIADATVNIEPTAEDLVEIALLVAERVKRLDTVPRIAMLSFSNFGSTIHPLTEKVRRATEMIKQKAPDLIVEGEMMADTAMNTEVLNEFYPFNKLKERPNVLICPDLTSANVAYKLLSTVGGAVAIGPMLLGIKKPVYLLGPGSMVDEIVNITAMAVFESQRKSKK